MMEDVKETEVEVVDSLDEDVAVEEELPMGSASKASASIVAFPDIVL